MIAASIHFIAKLLTFYCRTVVNYNFVLMCCVFSDINIVVKCMDGLIILSTLSFICHSTKETIFMFMTQQDL